MKLILLKNKFTTADFQIQLSYKNWENVFSENDVSSSFNKLCNTYLRLFNSSFNKKRACTGQVHSQQKPRN